jgi:hypothetical protein
VGAEVGVGVEVEEEEEEEQEEGGGENVYCSKEGRSRGSSKGRWSSRDHKMQHRS